MMCQNCGTQLPDGTPMCPTCGAQLYAAQPQQPYMDPNQNFNQPYVQAPYVAAPAKKNNTGLIIGIIVAIVAVIAVIAAIVLLKKDDDDDGGSKSKKNKYNGTYELESVEMYGQEFTVKELEEASGQTIDATLTVKGKKCTLDAEFVGVSNASGEIEFDGDIVTIDDGTEVLQGDYIEDEKAIVLEASGVSMKFVKQ